MLLTVGIQLYTSRIVLQALGIDDYGIYSAVGGIIIMFTFINSSMISSTQRFITFAIGRKDEEQLQRTFSASVQIHAIISLCIFILGETVGLWFLQEKMVFPHDRMSAVMWVYQCSIFTCILNIMAAPYNADVIAHEKMAAFAYVSIVDVILKLLIAFLLFISPFDKLISYAVLIAVVQIIIRSIYVIYCHRHFMETRYRNIFDPKLLKQMSGFAGWSFWGNLANILYTQGLNILLNVFFGPVTNAARGIAVQVQSLVQQFVGNFQMAINPQITKYYASNELSQMRILMFRSAKYSFFLLYIIALPIILEADFILTLWLKDVPKDTTIFTRIMLCIGMLYTLASPCTIANQATGNVKVYQAVVGGILLMIVPLSYFVLKIGAPAYFVFIIHFIVESIAQIARITILRRQISIQVNDYFKNICLPIIIVVALSCILPISIHCKLYEGWIRFIVVGFISVLSTGSATFIFGLNGKERLFIIAKVKSVFNGRKPKYDKN